MNTLPEMLLDAAAEDPGRPFLRFEGTDWSRGAAADAVLRAAGWFGRAGLAKRRVALLLDNCPEFIVAWLGAAAAGAVLVPIDPELRGEELTARLEHTRPGAIVTGPSTLPAIAALLERMPSLNHVIVVGDAPAGTTPWAALIEGAPRKRVSIAPLAPMEIIYTAGTTARARGVVWRHGGLPATATAAARMLGLGAHDRLMIVLPLFAANAQYSVAMALAAGASILLERGFSHESFWNAAREGGATQVSLSGSLLTRLQAEPQRDDDADHAVRRVVTMGTPSELHEAFECRFGVSVIEAFAVSEVGLVALNPVERGRRKLGTVGLPAAFCEVAILDEQMRPVPAGVAGDIWIRPRLAEVWGGEYFDDDEANARAWKNGWLRSGDVGAADEEGFLTLVGRRDDALRWLPAVCENLHRVA